MYSLSSCLLRSRLQYVRSIHTATSQSIPTQKPIEAAYYRGGTSRAVMIQPKHLPRERAKWPDIFREIMGSGDPYGRQLNGMGAGISSLSKICLVEPYGTRDNDVHRPQKSENNHEVDVDYTFVGLGIEKDEVDVAGNCGNMSSAIGPYAYNSGILTSQIYAQGDGRVTVKIRNTNTGKFINSTFEVANGQAAVVGDYTIDGVAGSGPRIKLDFMHPYGSKTGKLLPTGNKVDNIMGYEVSCVDGPNPAVFIRAIDVGVDDTILPDSFNKLPDKLDLLERIRRSAAVAMGIVTSEDAVPRTIPKIGLVSNPSTHSTLSGQTLLAEHTDLVVRFLSDGQPHRAIPLTAALTTAVAARVPGTVVDKVVALKPVMKDAITIGHASGRIQVNATMDEVDPLLPISATVYRTSKRLFEGTVFWTDRGTEQPDDHIVERDGSLGLAFVLESKGRGSDQKLGDAKENKSTGQ